MKSSLSIVVASSTLAFLTACGGGSDSSTAPTSAPTAITSGNQTNVARASIDGGLAVSLAQGGVGGGTTGAAAATRSHALGLAVRHALAAVASRKSVASVGAHAAGITTSTANCSNGGTVTVSFDDKDGNSQLSSGDVIGTTFAQCREGATLSLNGGASITVTATPSASQFTVSAQFQNLVLVDSGTTASINGTVAVTETDPLDVTTDVLQVGSSGLTVGVASTAYNDTVTFASGTSITTVSLDGGGSTSVALNGTISATSINGSVSITTPVPVSISGTDAYPSTGQVRIAGAAGSTLLVTVLSNSQVKLDLDSNGDGTVDSSTTVDWSTLLP